MKCINKIIHKLENYILEQAANPSLGMMMLSIILSSFIILLVAWKHLDEL